MNGDPSVPRPRLLLADSDGRRRQVTATLLRLGGYHVTEVATLGEVPKAAAGGVDVLVSETELADGDAVAYAKALRANAGTAALPILIVSADGTQGPAVESALGPATFLKMPARPSDLYARLAEVRDRSGRAGAHTAPPASGR